ncbi:putative GPI-anchored protein pfl2 isoform X2 [Monomorium pharaonis]|uniref:putative GPI-anchored protein pfl2 isoform X2 n=1 Tax=Monomorium pharaonis TaxID=307658 RepID=UPI00063F854D|nr:putative GPI-anchored protein pfl2 isoform X2 [Monomorium pharaonis]
MYGRQDNSGDGSSSQVPPWLMRAEVTIRHGDAVTSETVRMPPGTTTTTDAGGIRMICRWNTSEPNSTSTPASAATTSNAFPSSGSTAGGFGFQRGNILFTSTPPARPSQRSSGGSYTLPRSGSSGNDDSISSIGRANVSDSGYNSEQFSPYTYSSLPTRRPSQQNNRRCKSTCSIVLSTAGANKPNFEKATSAEFSKTAPSVDQWSHHRASHQYVFSRHQFSTVPEVCEDCAEGSASSAFTTHFCTRVAEKTANSSRATAISKDVASQTTDIESARSSSTVNSSRIGRKSGTGIHQRSEQKKEDIRSPPAPVGNTSTSSPVDPDKSDSSAKEDSSKRKSRTVHIDVYCTGSDDASTDTISEDERSTPMTVFENEDVKVTHTQATDNLPRGFQDANAFLKRNIEQRCASFRNTPIRMPSLASSKGYDSDEVLSSLYPSRFSSYSGIRDLDSVPWSTVSSSTALSPCDYESTTMTSSKDTFSDIESLINNKSGLTPCDSFEYANITDRDRIRRMDILAKAGNERNRTWRSPQIERRHLLQNRKMREYFKRHEINLSSGESDEDSDESGAVGWSFVSGDEKSRFVKRDSMIRRTDKGQLEESYTTDLGSEHRNAQEEHSQFAIRKDYVPKVLRDRIGPFGSKSPSPLPSTIPSRVTSPFTTPYGERTDHIVKASKFGAVINAFRKPGHHIGPSKNPTCSCEHCRRYFENQARERSSSLSELERHLAFKSRKNSGI